MKIGLKPPLSSTRSRSRNREFSLNLLCQPQPQLLGTHTHLYARPGRDNPHTNLALSTTHQD
jgi:hypothetical protein